MYKVYYTLLVRKLMTHLQTVLIAVIFSLVQSKETKESQDVGYGRRLYIKLTAFDLLYRRPICASN
jgi:hypothetical protein